MGLFRLTGVVWAGCPSWLLILGLLQISTSCAGGRHNMHVDLWPFVLESGVRVTCDVGYLYANFSLPRPLCSRLRPDVRDRQTSDVRQTDVKRASSLNAPTLGAGHYNSNSCTLQTLLLCVTEFNYVFFRLRIWKFEILCLTKRSWWRWQISRSLQTRITKTRSRLNV